MVLARDVSSHEARHGEVLLPRVLELLGREGWDRCDVELLAVGIGPGSFTGLRVGLATAKGWALATGVPIVGVISPAVVAAPLLQQGHGTVAVVTDAFKGEVYVTVFRSGEAADDPSMLASPLNTPPELAAARLREHVPEGPITLVGDGIRRFPAVWGRVLGARAQTMPEAADVPCPVALSRLAVVQYKRQGASDLVELEPLYVRGSDAQLPKAPLAT